MLRTFSKKKPSQTFSPSTEEMTLDAPIKSSQQDLLRRVSFAERIATVLSSPSPAEGKVFAIRGDWGSGKSSLRNLITEQFVNNETAVDWLEFNPWQWPDSEASTRALFQQIGNKLGGSFSAGASKRATKLRRYASIIISAGAPLRKAGVDSKSVSGWLTNATLVSLTVVLGITLPSASTIITVILALGLLAPVLGAALAWIGQDKWTQPLDAVRKDLERSLSSADRPLVVFIDDIDRLEPEQIRIIFRHVKLNANLPNIVFVLLFQTSIVESALSPIANGEGREFLEKIVQANFDLPTVPSHTVHRIFAENLSSMASSYATAENGFEEVRWGNLLIGCIQPFLRNLRDVRRLISSISIHLPLHKGNHAFEVNIIDFFTLETLKLFEPDFYILISKNRSLFLQNNRFSDDQRDKENKALLDELISGIRKERHEVVREAVKRLFPQLEWALGGYHYGYEWLDAWASDKRVCSSRYFDRYFELQIPAGTISESEFSGFISASADAKTLDNVILDFEDRDLIAALAETLDAKVKHLPIENAAILLPAMFRIAQSLVNYRKDGPFNSPWVSAWRSISWYLDRLQPNERGDLAIRAFEFTGAYSVAAMLISLDESAREKSADDSPMFTDNDLENFKVCWSKKIGEIASDGTRLLEKPDLASLLYRWRDFSGSLSEPQAWAQEIARSDDGFASFIAAFLSEGRSHGADDLVSKNYKNIELKDIEQFLPTYDISGRLNTLKRETLSQDQIQALDLLLKQINKAAG